MNPEDFRARDSAIVELALPAHMLFLMMEECQKAGLELRADVMHYLNMAAVKPLAKCDQLSVSRLARRIDDCSRTLLNNLSPDDPRHGLYVCANFALLLVSEGRIEEKDNMAVLVSLLLMDDVKDDRKDEAGNEVVWRFEEKKWIDEAKRLLSSAFLMGLYLNGRTRLSA